MKSNMQRTMLTAVYSLAGKGIIPILLFNLLKIHIWHIASQILAVIIKSLQLLIKFKKQSRA